MGAKRLVIASGNRNKIEEIRDLTKGLGLEVVGIHDLGDFPPVIEDGATFRDNARKKALETARLVQELVLADDSGLEVDALGGAPGVYSARYAGVDGDDEANNRLLLHKLEGIPLEQRGAQFRCVMALAAPTGEVEYSEGICRGIITFEPRGNSGFGYDPLFLVPEYGKTFAELGPEIKNTISHRSMAMAGMLKLLSRV
ncbi:MAG: XTP/dITP diphosphatase [Firmicutes bacterium]|jgi:XTP/dITP diphosphohydrolase|nr:XTP/dITP diphosphatase [Bacillota bacterium]NLO66694.1 XTP/dITP diphosphatase [Bacillota bacterium]